MYIAVELYFNSEFCVGKSNEDNAWYYDEES